MCVCVFLFFKTDSRKDRRTFFGYGCQWFTSSVTVGHRGDKAKLEVLFENSRTVLKPTLDASGVTPMLGSED